ncbi:19878_t:CDS:2 [Racocetra fulgida]|uniref:19878_t:CDS:1 n=1 Tax=Racocetra fulgida TaxID=60492 RepID=A0A9N8ZVP0_9GLOM|nr:19878_t:CDS:2 [Racocetra fulgida]
MASSNPSKRPRLSEVAQSDSHIEENHQHLQLHSQQFQLQNNIPKQLYQHNPAIVNFSSPQQQQQSFPTSSDNMDPLLQSSDPDNKNEESLNKQDLQRLEQVIDLVFPDKSAAAKEAATKLLNSSTIQSQSSSSSTRDDNTTSVVLDFPILSEQVTETEQIISPLGFLLNHTFPNSIVELVTKLNKMSINPASLDFLNPNSNPSFASANNPSFTDPSAKSPGPPTKELCKKLINEYFTKFNVVIPILNRRKFMSHSGDKTKHSELLVNAALAVAAARYSDDPSIRKTPNKPGVQMAHALHLERDDTSLPLEEDEERRRLSRILGQIWKFGYSSQPKAFRANWLDHATDQKSVLRHIRSALAKWLKELPDELQYQYLPNNDQQNHIQLTTFSTFAGARRSINDSIEELRLAAENSKFTSLQEMVKELEGVMMIANGKSSDIVIPFPIVLQILESRNSCGLPNNNNFANNGNVPFGKNFGLSKSSINYKSTGPVSSNLPDDDLKMVDPPKVEFNSTEQTPEQPVANSSPTVTLLPETNRSPSVTLLNEKLAPTSLSSPINYHQQHPPTIHQQQTNPDVYMMSPDYQDQTSLQFNQPQSNIGHHILSNSTAPWDQPPFFMDNELYGFVNAHNYSLIDDLTGLYSTIMKDVDGNNSATL